MKMNNPKTMGHGESSPEREVHSNTSLPKEDRKVSNKQHNPTPTRGTTTNTTQSVYKEENKIRAELSNMEAKK